MGSVFHLHHPVILTRWLNIFVALLVSSVPVAAAADDRTAGAELFELKVRPVLMGTCFKCHGGEKVSSSLRLDSRAALLEGGERGPAVRVGDAAGSRLIQAIRYSDKDLRMPPHERLPKATVDAFARWIDQGAVWPAGGEASPQDADAGRHWAFRQVEPVSPPAPADADDGAPDRSIDRFIGARQQTNGVTPMAVGPSYADPPRHVRSDGPAADADRSARLSGRRPAGRVRARDRPLTRIAAVRRAMGQALA